MYDWKWTSTLLCLKNGGNKNNQEVPTEISAKIFFSCLLSTGIIASCTPQVQVPPNKGCRAGAAQCDKALISSKLGHPGPSVPAVSTPHCSLTNAEVVAQGAVVFTSKHFYIPLHPTLLHLQQCDPSSCPQGKQTDDFHTAHVCSPHWQSWCGPWRNFIW